jgi:hypothetical protein
MKKIVIDQRRPGGRTITYNVGNWNRKRTLMEKIVESK